MRGNVVSPRYVFVSLWKLITYFYPLLLSCYTSKVLYVKEIFEKWRQVVSKNKNYYFHTDVSYIIYMLLDAWKIRSLKGEVY